MAQTATIYNFDIELADIDRGVYESIALRVAQHPSESDEYLVARVLAYCLEYSEGISFSSGISTPDDPAIAVRDLTGALRVWIDIGSPDAARLHKASKAAARVVVYTHKSPEQWLKQLAGERVHNGERVEIFSLDRELVASLVRKLARRMAFSLSIHDRHVMAAFDTENLEGAITRHALSPK